MILDLLRALPAAILVGVLPGWFWAGCLCVTADRAERLAYSMGFSVALVPTVALLQARLFGSGVTPGIAGVSVLLVLGAGLAARLAFGPAKGSDAPIASYPAAPGPLTLAPLIGAAALLLGVLLGALPDERAVALLAPLVFLAGVAYLLESRRAESPCPPREEVSRGAGARIAATARPILLLAVLALTLLRSYPGPLRYDWPFPRGVDKYEHAVMVEMMLEKGSTESFMLYPPGFHVLAALVARISGLEPMNLFAILAPALLLFPALACYALARRVWGWEVGVTAAFFSGLVTGGAYQHVSHARYANLIGIFLLVLAVGALVRLYASSSLRDGLTLALIGSSVVFYHQVASLYEAALLALISALFFPYLLLRKRRTGLALLLSLALLGLLSVAYAWDTYDLPSLIGGLLGESGTGRGGEAVSMALGTKPVPPFESLLETITHPALWLGFLGGLLLLAGWRRRTGAAETLAGATLLAWALLMFAGSRTVLSSFPDRFERDLSLPLSLLAALALVVVLRSLVARRPAKLLAASVAGMLLAGAVGLQAARNIEEAAGPAGRAIDKPPPAEVVEAGEWLEAHNRGGNILVTPSVGPVSARGLLAMGDYDAMQTYSIHRIERNRDLPPFGAGPLRDALFALQHPANERTRRILRENDVRYVVLEKGHPGIDLRLYERNDDLYRKVFENEVAVIFATRTGAAARPRP